MPRIGGSSVRLGACLGDTYGASDGGSTSLSELYAGGDHVPAGSWAYPDLSNHCYIPTGGTTSIRRYIYGTKGAFEAIETSYGGGPFSTLSGTNWVSEDFQPGASTMYTYIYLYADGTMEIRGTDSLSGSVSLFNSYWYWPVTGGIGSSFYVRFTRQNLYYQGGSGASSPSTGWLSLSSSQSVYVQKVNSNTGAWGATYMVEVSPNQSSPIYTTAGINIEAIVSN